MQGNPCPSSQSNEREYRCTGLHEYLEDKTTTHVFEDVDSCLGTDETAWGWRFDSTDAASVVLSSGGSTAATVPTPLKVTHSAGCTSPTLELQLATTVSSLSVTGSLTVAGDLTVHGSLSLQGVDVLASMQALQSATQSAAQSSTGCSLPWTRSCNSPVVVNMQAVSSSLKSFRGGFATSTHAYYVPHRNSGPSATVARISLSDFSTSGVEHFDLTTISSSLAGFQGGFATSTHAYYVPNCYNTGTVHGHVVRISLSDFSTSGVEHFDLATVSSSLGGFSGGFATSTHAYYVPSYNSGSNSGHVARISLSDFSTSGVEHFDLATVSSTLVGFEGGFATSTHAYYVPTINGNVVRISLSDFSTSGVDYFDLATVSSSLWGFSGGFATSTHGYLVPYYNGGGYQGNAVRIPL